MISIITPCYNGEDFLDKYFNSILNQTFKDIELIFIDDCSIDNTLKIAKEYKSKLKEQGIVMKIYTTSYNMGAAGAVNLGLKYFSRKYLMFLDSDDIMYPNHIEEKINFMEETGYEFVACGIRKIDESGKVYGNISIAHKENGINIFERLILRQQVIFCPIAFIYNSTAFLSVNPEREIFITRSGQNWQILLPMAYKYKIYFLDKILGDYVVRKNSTSRTENREENLEKIGAKEEILRETLNRINPENKAYYFSLFEK